MPFRFPVSFHEQQSLLLPASGNVVWGGAVPGYPWVQYLSSILIQTTIPDLCTSHENYPDENGYGKPTSHSIHHTPPRQGMGAGPE